MPEHTRKNDTVTFSLEPVIGVVGLQAALRLVQLFLVLHRLVHEAVHWHVLLVVLAHLLGERVLPLV